MKRLNKTLKTFRIDGAPVEVGKETIPNTSQQRYSYIR
jgi:hypothetical protein